MQIIEPTSLIFLTPSHAHIHLENHVPFVKAQEIEAKLMGFSTE
jgi:hypothetical protein